MTIESRSTAFLRWLRPAVVMGAMAAFLPVQAQQHPGGFIENANSAQSRPVLTQSQIASFLPSKGPFTFPAPYNTQAVRLTNASDCNGQDCVNYAGYSYWRNINNHVGEESMLIFVGLEKSRGGKGPSLLKYNKVSGAVTDLGPLFNDSHPLSWASGEGWYFSASIPTALYLNSGATLQRLDVITGQQQTVVDVNAHLGGGHFLWQAHSSDNDRVHSATVKSSSSYQTLGCMTYNSHSGNFKFFASIGNYDECQVDRSGNWLLIKENVDGKHGEDNRIINLLTGQERVLLDADGAAGHSDLGYGYMVAADNWANNANTWKLWDFTTGSLTGKTVYHNHDWNVFAPAHVSHTNARSGVAAGEQYACGSSANRNNSAHANEIICFSLDGSTDTLVVAPVMTNLDTSSGRDDYSLYPKGNLDVSGRYFFWTSNAGGSRLDAFLVKVPDHKLTGTIDYTPPPAPPPPPPGDSGDGDIVDDTDTTPPPAGDSPDPGQTGDVVWTDIVQATVVGSTLTKTSGCDGCPDAGAVSVQQLTTGDGYMEFSATDGSSMLFTGLSNNHSGTNGTEIDFAIRLQGGYAEVRELGAYRTDIPYKTGDTFRISVKEDRVSYAKNGDVFYSNTRSVSYPLSVAAALYTLGASIENVVLSADFTTTGEPDSPSNPAPSDPAPPVDTALVITPSPELVQANDVVWRDSVRVGGVNSQLIKTSGCDGCADAGAFSVQQLMTGDGYMEFSAADDSSMLFAGLSNTNSGTDGAGIDFAVRLQSGYAEVRERGIYRTDTSYEKGDTFRISVEEGRVSYAKNGVVFYNNSRSVRYPLSVDTALYTLGVTIEKVEFAIDSAPQISDVSAVADASNAVTLKWNTNMPSESLVEFGKSHAYNNQTDHVTTLTDSHTATLNGLEPGTRYHFRVFARDADGNISNTSDHSFVTPTQQ